MQNNRLISIIDSFSPHLLFASYWSVTQLLNWRRMVALASHPIDSVKRTLAFRFISLWSAPSIGGEFNCRTSASSAFRWIGIPADGIRRNWISNQLGQRDEWGGIVTKSSKRRRQRAITHGPERPFILPATDLCERMSPISMNYANIFQTNAISGRVRSTPSIDSGRN